MSEGVAACGCTGQVTFQGLSRDYKARLWAVIALNASMFAVEMVGGAMAGSQALQADALDFLGDTLTYGMSLAVIGLSLRVRATAALIKGATLALMGLWVLGATVWHVFVLGTPRAEVMGLIGFLSLAANVASVLILIKYKDGDANVRSVWLCSRNDAIGNIAVMVAALGVWGTARGWPDLVVAAILASLFLNSASKIFRQALAEWWLAKGRASVDERDSNVRTVRRMGMYKSGELAFAVGLAIMSAAFPALAQQPQQQMPMQQGQQQMPMMGHGTMMGGQPGMMGGQQGMPGMMGGQQGMMGGCPMMGGMMGSGMQGMGGPGMQGMMGQGMPMMGSGMQGMMGMGCPWCGPGMMGSGYATPQPSLNLTAADVKSYLERWTTGNPNIKVANVVEQDANTITADIVTSDKGGLVQRYTFDRQNGFYHPVQ